MRSGFGSDELLNLSSAAEMQYHYHRRHRPDTSPLLQTVLLLHSAVLPPAQSPDLRACMCRGDFKCNDVNPYICETERGWRLVWHLV